MSHGSASTLTSDCRYVNMDYIYVSAMLRHLRVRKLVTYDIACQWVKGLLERVAKFPSHLQIALPTGRIKYGIPKLHWHGHERKNDSQFSLNYIPGAARNDGEGIERRWWWVQPVANSTKTMGPGRRQGTLEDQWGYANWRTIVDFGTYTRHLTMPADVDCVAAEFMRRRYMHAREHAQIQEKTFNDLTKSLQKSNVTKWEKQVSEWEADMTKPDPYHIASTGVYLYCHKAMRLTDET